MKKNAWIWIALGMVVLFAAAGILYNQLTAGFENNFNTTESIVSQPEDVVEESQTAEEPQTAVEPQSVEEQQPIGEEVNENMAPEITVEDLEGNKVSLSDFRGTPVVLNFWASWCPPCKSEMPEFNKLYEEYKGQVQFIMVNLTDGSRETKDTAQAYIDSQGYTFPIYFDTDSSAAIAYQAYSIPMTFLINEDGGLEAYAAGAVSEEELREGLKLILP